MTGPIAGALSLGVFLTVFVLVTIISRRLCLKGISKSGKKRKTKRAYT